MIDARNAQRGRRDNLRTRANRASINSQTGMPPIPYQRCTSRYTVAYLALSLCFSLSLRRAIFPRRIYSRLFAINWKSRAQWAPRRYIAQSVLSWAGGKKIRAREEHARAGKTVRSFVCLWLCESWGTGNRAQLRADVPLIAREGDREKDRERERERYYYTVSMTIAKAAGVCRAWQPMPRGHTCSVSYRSLFARKSRFRINRIFLCVCFELCKLLNMFCFIY